MKQKLNYIFSQVLDNYKTALKENRTFYIGLGIFFIGLNIGMIIFASVLDFRLFDGVWFDNIYTSYMYIYLSVLVLPCLAVLKQETEQPLKFGEVFLQNIGVVLLVGILSVVGVVFMIMYEGLFQDFSSLYPLKGLLGTIGSILITFISLLLLRSVVQKQIPFFPLLLEALVLTIILFSLVQEVAFFLIYGVFQSFTGGLIGVLAKIAIAPIIFITINLFIGPLLVLIVTSMIGYEKRPELKLEESTNEQL